MNCASCDTKLDLTTATVEEQSHDTIEVSVSCPNCDRNTTAQIPASDFNTDP